jgi:hypothetical protein
MTTGKDLNSMWWALHRMMFSNPLTNKEDRRFNSHNYNKFRKRWSEYLKENHPAKLNPQKFGETMSRVIKEDWIDNDSKRQLVGLAFSLSHKQRKEEDPIGYIQTQLNNSKKGHEEQRRLWREDPEWAEKQRKKLSANVTGEKNPMFGTTHSDETKRKMSEFTKRRRWLKNSVHAVYVDIDLIQDYLDKGYTMGRGAFHKNKEGHR